MRRAALAGILLLTIAGCNGREKYPNAVGGGNADRGRRLISKYGCDSCHAIPGADGPQGTVGPPLAHIASRPVIAGRFPNNPQTMTNWIENPQALDPTTAMPNMNVTPADARDITAYLDTLE